MNKFNTLLESNITRFQSGGFLTGDIVKFKSGAMGSDWAKKQPEVVLAKLKEFTECDEHIRVSCIKPLRPAVSGGAQQIGYMADDFYCDIVREKAPGMFMDFITVPSEILEYSEQGINLPDIPDSQRGDDPTQAEPQEIKQENSADPMNPYDQTGVNDGNKSLPTSDTKQDHTPAPVDNFSTKVYMQGF